jgi:hypothetical protein
MQPREPERPAGARRSLGKKNAMRNDVAVYDALRFDPDAGETVWTGRMGTRAAILRDGFSFDPASLSYCPHQWLDEQGYIDLKLARKHPHHLGF